MQDIALVRDFLTPQGYEVGEAFNGEEALQKIRNSKPDIVILDWVLPGLQGIDVCREIKTNLKDIFIIILSQHKEAEYKVKAFRAGCDDYLTKPCELQELEIRIKNLLNKSSFSLIQGNSFQYEDIHVDFSFRKVTRLGKVVNLNDKEYHLLEYLLRNVNKVVTRSMILEEVWGSDAETFTNIVDIYINYLRRKLNGSLIKTIQGIGYIVQVPISRVKAA